MAVRRPNPETDPFRPPAIPTEVLCLHCQQEYESYLMEWREEEHDGKREGFWCCPTPGCGGKGFGFDIFPTDPEYRDENGEAVGPFGESSDEDDEAQGGAEWQWEDAGETPPWGDPIDADALLDEDRRDDEPSNRADESGIYFPPINLDEGARRPRWGDDEDDGPW